MDTNRLKRFAAEARNKLIEGVKNRLEALGFDKKGQPAELPQAVEGGAVFMGDTVSTEFYDQWMSLYHNIQKHSVREVLEEAAYTWFNRMVAIRIMSKQGFISPVLEYEAENIRIPVIVAEARQGRLPQNMPEDTRRKLAALIDDDTRTDEQFRMLIVAYCHSNPILHRCFGTIADYTELLLPTNILSADGFVDLLNHTTYISEEDFASPELIGWLYQFYISERKDEVFAKKGKFEADEIPAATQIFTPNWIVKYMVQNTVGRIYLDNNDYAIDLKAKWKYLVEPTEPTPADCIYPLTELQELKVADLACGSGHILNECFDMLFDLYVYEGYSRTQAVDSILTYNLTGIDLDARAKQLATFALLMKACQKDASYADAHLMPRVWNMPKPIAEVYKKVFLTQADAKAFLAPLLSKFIMGSNQNIMDELTDALLLMDNADSLGSIMKFTISEQTRNVIAARTAEYEQQSFVEKDIKRLLPYMRIILALTEQYTALVMNPPYMGSGNMNETLSKYVKANYEEGKADLFSVFMLLSIDRLAERGKYAMINMQSWMFLSSFEKLRTNLLKNYHIENLLHLGPRTFDELSGEVVQNVCFVVGKTMLSNGQYFRLVDGKDCSDKERMFLEDLGYYSNVSQLDFEKIPGSPIGYWVSEKIFSGFAGNLALSDVVKPLTGLQTSDNARFLRYWFEISYNKLGLNFKDAEDAKDSRKKWFPYNKGGSFRKWYGNQELLINWENDGTEIKSITGPVLRNPNYYFKKSISWSLTSSVGPGFRYNPQAALFDVNGMSLFCNEGISDMFILGCLNTTFYKYIANVINPTLALQCGDVARFPYPKPMEIQRLTIENIARINISISKFDWDAHETSWDFKENELVRISKLFIVTATIEDQVFDQYRNPLKQLLEEYKRRWKTAFEQLHRNEEELNRQFIEIYGLQDELTPDVPLNEITILQQGEISIENNELVWHDDVIIKQLISYAIGTMMGRYRLDNPGLHIAHPNPTAEEIEAYDYNGHTFQMDDDGIIPLMSANSEFTDNATLRLKQWISIVFDEENLVDNLNLMEQCLGKSIDDYLVKDFWKDHKKMYQNRPIYWLFSSKKGAFQCIAYMHRMDAYTAERIRTNYLLPHIDWLVQKQQDMQANAANLSTRERRELDNIGKQITECREYHDRLHVIADQQIAFDLDDGVVVNYAKFGDVVAKIK